MKSETKVRGNRKQGTEFPPFTSLRDIKYRLQLNVYTEAIFPTKFNIKNNQERSKKWNANKKKIGLTVLARRQPVRTEEFVANA